MTKGSARPAQLHGGPPRDSWDGLLPTSPSPLPLWRSTANGVNCVSPTGKSTSNPQCLRMGPYLKVGSLQTIELR